MDIISSDYLATAALAISIASAYYSKKQSELARIAARNDHRAYLSDKHEKYRLALKQIGGKHKDDISRLSHEAGNALTVIVGLFDEYDSHRHEARYLRHLVHECSEMVYYAFKGQLGWQTSSNITDRFYHMMDLEINLKPHRNYSNATDFRAAFENEYFKDPNQHQEIRLLQDFYFCDLVNNITRRVDSTRNGTLIMEIQEIYSPFNSLFKELKPRVRESAHCLAEMLEESSLEHFPLKESPNLAARMKYKKVTLGTLSSLWLHEIDKDYADKYSKLISWSIYTCAILHAIQGFHSWGWDME